MHANRMSVQRVTVENPFAMQRFDIRFNASMVPRSRGSLLVNIIEMTS